MLPFSSLTAVKNFSNSVIQISLFLTGGTRTRSIKSLCEILNEILEEFCEIGCEFGVVISIRPGARPVLVKLAALSLINGLKLMLLHKQ